MKMVLRASRIEQESCPLPDFPRVCGPANSLQLPGKVTDSFAWVSRANE